MDVISASQWLTATELSDFSSELTNFLTPPQLVCLWSCFGGGTSTQHGESMQGSLGMELANKMYPIPVVCYWDPVPFTSLQIGHPLFVALLAAKYLLGKWEDTDVPAEVKIRHAIVSHPGSPIEAILQLATDVQLPTGKQWVLFNAGEPMSSFRSAQFFDELERRLPGPGPDRYDMQRSPASNGTRRWKGCPLRLRKETPRPF